MSTSRLIFLRNIFLILFILTTLWFCIFGVNVYSSGSPTEEVVPTYISLFTSAITFLGFVITTVLSFRREKREARQAELSQMQKEIELEKARLELEQLKKQINKKK